MGYRMKGSPAKLGTIQGTSGHRSALKQSIGDIAGDDIFGPAKEEEEESPNKHKSVTGTRHEHAEGGKKIKHGPEGEVLDEAGWEASGAEERGKGTEGMKEEYADEQYKTKKTKEKGEDGKKKSWFDQLGYIVDEAVNRQGKSTQSFEVWKNRGKPGWESGHFQPHHDENRTYKYGSFQGEDKDIKTEEEE